MLKILRWEGDATPAGSFRYYDFTYMVPPKMLPFQINKHEGLSLEEIGKRYGRDEAQKAMAVIFSYSI